MAQKENFGVAGLEIGTKIYFLLNPNIVVYVSSEDRENPKNGGTMVTYDLDDAYEPHYSITLLTKRLMGIKPNTAHDMDCWSYWKHGSYTLRELLNKNKT